MSQILEIKGGPTDEASQALWERVFCGREELLFVQTLIFLTLKIFYSTRTDMKHKRKKKNVSYIS